MEPPLSFSTLATRLCPGDLLFFTWMCKLLWGCLFFLISHSDIKHLNPGKEFCDVIFDLLYSVKHNRRFLWEFPGYFISIWMKIGVVKFLNIFACVLVESVLSQITYDIFRPCIKIHFYQFTRLNTDTHLFWLCIFGKVQQNCICFRALSHESKRECVCLNTFNHALCTYSMYHILFNFWNSEKWTRSFYFIFVFLLDNKKKITHSVGE